MSPSDADRYVMTQWGVFFSVIERPPTREKEESRSPNEAIYMFFGN